MRLKPGRRSAVLVLAVFLALGLSSTVSALTLETFQAQLTASNPTYTTPQFDLLNSVPQANPASGLKDAYVYVTLLSGAPWATLTAVTQVTSGNSVNVEILDPTNFQVASGQAAGGPLTLAVQSTAQSPLITGKPYTVHVQQLVTTGTTDNIQVTVTGTCTGPCIIYPISTSKTSTCTDIFCSGLIWWIIGAIIVVAASVMLAFVFVRRGGGGAETQTTTVPPTPMQPPTPSPFGGGGGETTVVQGGGGTKQYYAGFEMPNGQIVPITDVNKEFGRQDFLSFVPPDVQSLISRRHFKISFAPRERTFMIEDLGSANGTMVNNSEIRGKGRVPLKNDDIVSLGGVVNLKFKG